MEFSVLMSVYENDHPVYLREALTSIWAIQTLKPNQIVIVQDGPIPKSLQDVIENFTRLAPVTSVVLPENSGLGVALSVGLKHCTSDYIARMDSDDISKKDRFKKQIDFLEKNPDIDVLGCFIEEFITTPESPLALRKVPEKNLQIREKLKIRNAVNHVTVMAKKSKILASGNYQAMLFFEDYYLWARMFLKQCTFHNLQESLVNVRIGKDMIGRRMGWGYIKKEINFFCKLHEIGFINRFEYLKAITLRVPLRLLPKKLLSEFYLKIIRS